MSPPDEQATTGGTQRDRRWVITRIGIPAAGVIALAITLGVIATGGSDAEAADGAQSSTTAVVERRDLVDRETFGGTLGYGEARAVVNDLNGTLTRAADEGATRARGDVLYRVGEEPVILMQGQVPAWRDLRQGDEGIDVRQLEGNLSTLGYDAGGELTVDGDFDWATAEAVRDWQEAISVDETGAVALGQVIFLSGERRVSAVKAPIGSRLRPGQEVMTTTGTARSVTVDLDARRQDLVKVGGEQEVELPDGTRVTATVDDVGAVARAASADADPTIEVVLSLAADAKVSALDAAPVEVNLASERAADVLAVPVTALLALAGGGYGVERVDPDGTSILAVETGLFADGYVEVSGAGVEEGMTVEVPE